MELHFLGTTGYHPNRRRDTACFMIPEHGILLDAGTGIFRARELISTPELHIFLTHTHLDHVAGLTFLLGILQGKSVNRVVVYCDPLKHSVLQDHLFHPLLFPVSPPFELAALTDRPVPLPGGGRLNAFELAHPGGCLGFRLDWPHTSLAYVTDTTADPQAAYVQHLREVPLLIHECYFPDGCEEHARLTGHSCLTPVAQVAREAEAGRTALVHLSPDVESDSLLDLNSVAGIYSELFIPEDGEVVRF